MFQHFPKALKRAAALALSVLLTAAQMIAPISALATEGVQPPQVTLYYQLTPEEAPAAMPVMLSMVGEQPVYWAMLPEAAFMNPITIDIMGTGDPLVTFAPATGTQLNPVNAAAVDGMSMAANVEVYTQGVLSATYPLYLSTVAMPAPAPVLPSAFVQIYYVDANNNPLWNGQQEIVGAADVIAEYAGDWQAQGYQLREPSVVPVTAQADGSTTPAMVTFTFDLPPTIPDTGDGGGDVGGGDVGGGDVGGGDVGGGDVGGGDVGGGDVDGGDIGGEAGGEVIAPVPMDVNLYALTNDTVNFRDVPSTTNSNKVFPNVPAKTLVWVYQSIGEGKDQWLKIRYEDQATDCYVLASFITLMSQEESDAISNGSKEPVLLPVKYINQETGASFYEETAPCAVGMPTEIHVKNEMVPQNYAIQSAPMILVTVSADGVPDTNEAIFYFLRTKAQASVHMSYTDGVQELAGEDLPFEEGDHPVAPKDELAPVGYSFVGASDQTVHVDANGVATPSVVTFTYQKPAVLAAVTFRYVFTDGAYQVNDRVENLASNTYPTENYKQEPPAGYTYEGASAAEVVVDENGNANPNVVEFTYAPIPVAGKITIQYVDDQGNPVAQERVEQLGANVYQSSMYAINVPAGYTYQGVSAETFTIDKQGVAMPGTIVFTYLPVVVPPKAAEVTLIYMDAKGNTLYPSVKQQWMPGTYNAIDTVLGAPENYEFAGANPQQVTVDAAGIATSNTITYTYNELKKPLGKADVTFHYVSTAGEQLSQPLVTAIEEGTYSTAEYAAVFADYTLQGATSDTVTITPDNKANPAQVTFTYIKNLKEATVEVHYLNAIGDELPGSPEIVKLQRDQTITPNSAYIPAGYHPIPGTAQSYNIKVNAQFVATPNAVTFSYDNKVIQGKVIVYYVDTTTGKNFASQELSLNPGTHTIVPDAAVATSKYTLLDASIKSAEVKVDAFGNTTPTEVRFLYKPAETDMYMGYAVTNTQTALRKTANQQDSSIIKTLPPNTLVWIQGQITTSDGVRWDGAQLRLGASDYGYVRDSDIRKISQTEADYMIAEYDRQHPVKPEPPQQSTGYYITRGNDVPLRVTANSHSEARYYLQMNTVVYVMGQNYSTEQGWHISNYSNFTGYIRIDQLRKMTTAEVDAYLAGQKPTNPNQTPAPDDPYGKSSYGYVTKSGVNFRSTPNGNKIKTLNKYAMAMIIGTKEVNGVTWYYVNQSGKTGWVHGDFFHQMNLTEFNSFLNSKEYLQGLQQSGGSSGSNNNNNSGGGSSSGSSGKPTQGNVSSVEDWNVGTWQNTGAGTQTTYAPFNPYATPSVTASVSPSASVEPTSTFVIGTMIPIDYEDETKETQTNAVPWGLLGAAVVLIGGAGGVYAYALNQNKRRKAAAARAAAGRRAGVNGANGTTGATGTNGLTPDKQSQSPYTRRAVAAPPVSGTKQTAEQRNPNGVSTTGTDASINGVKNPYSSGSITGAGSNSANPYVNPYAPKSGAQTSDTPVGSVNGENTDAAAPASSNPYVRPMGAPASTDFQNETSSTNAVDSARRSRMQRYHDAEAGEKKSDQE
ncbi:MAG: SH3 domain-containing protein [Clostridia bacterium]